MEVKNINGEYIAVLDDNLFEGDNKFIQYINNNIICIKKEDDYTFSINMDDDIIVGVSTVKIDTQTNNTYIYTNDKLAIIKKIQPNTSIILSNNNGDMIGEICELPKFYNENNFDEIYPKFDISISDCIFSMRIYYSAVEYIDIPESQIYINIFSTIKYIEDIIHYCRNVNSTFIEDLCKYNAATFIVKDKESKEDAVTFSSEYKLTPNGILINFYDQKDFLLEFHYLFKLLIDGTWDIIFIDLEEEK